MTPKERSVSVPGSGVKGLADVVEALRRGAERPRTAQGYVHVGPAVLEEAAAQLEKAGLSAIHADVRERLEGVADELEARLEGANLTAATVRAIKAQGIRDALDAALPTSTKEEGAPNES